jgi:hypothetical protein
MTKQDEKEWDSKAWKARFQAGAGAALRAYCNGFEFWRGCRYKPCRCAHQCRGAAGRCLKRGLDRIPEEMQREVSLRVIAAIPADADVPTRAGRSVDLSMLVYGVE